MKTASTMLGISLCAAFASATPLAAEPLHKVVAGLNYQVQRSASEALVQAVRVRRDTGQVLVRYTNGKTGWVDASELRAYRQPIATDAGSYLFVAAAMACLLDEHRCGIGPVRRAPAAAPVAPASAAAPALAKTPAIAAAVGVPSGQRALAPASLPR
jgi:hypothetical protein